MNIKRAIDLSNMKRNTLQTAMSVILAAANLQGTAQVLPKITTPSFRKDTCNIIAYGALADGITLNTVPINKAIETCSKKGVVWWLCPPDCGIQVPWY
ncbi:hypothetical protein [Paraflavitalea speifideaquila]|uniref:hypothetical protein n=1 Tax=Paraflavitalea speifideaquila TaxID=3076558 RepID=UPI0028E1CECE|nr:hypothetical protein [Paraflavitalea speifideiaquila]